MLQANETHPLVYFLTGKTRKLSKQARQAFQEAERGRENVVIPMTVLEVPLRLSELSGIRPEISFRELVSRYQQDDGLFSLQDCTVNMLLAVENFAANCDPFDRVIVATAHTLGYSLIRHDGFLQEKQFVPTVW